VETCFDLETCITRTPHVDMSRILGYRVGNANYHKSQRAYNITKTDNPS
jgi:hypothetical protein